MKKRWIDKCYLAFDSPHKTVLGTAPGHHRITPTRKMRLDGFKIHNRATLALSSSMDHSKIVKVVEAE